VICLMRKRMRNSNLSPEEQGQRSPLNARRLGCSTAGLIILLIVMSIASIWGVNSINANGKVAQISYSNFQGQLKNGNVQSITVQGNKINGKLKQAQKQQSANGGGTYTNFVTYVPSFGDKQLLPLLESQGVKIVTKPKSNFSWLPYLLNFLPFVFLIGIGYLLFSRMQRGQGQSIFSLGKSGAKLYERRREHTTFKDVAGTQGAKAELKEIIEFLKDPTRFQRLGGKMPKGVLLVGPPGTGKTLLARAVAGEANVPFFNITGSNFMEMFVGVGASRVRDLFNEAKKASPAIIFIDELDSIGRLRGAGLGGGHDEREQTLNQLLSEMDGFEPNEEVVVMAATNRPDILDPALLRPGRFDRRITVSLPTMKDRQAILAIHARNKPLAEDVDLRRVASGTPGFSGADLQNLLNEAALLAARSGKRAIEREDIEVARDKILLGLERENMVLTEQERRLLAYHEAGHAILAALLPNADPIHKVTIVPRGKAMGVTQQLPERDMYIYPIEYLLDRLAVMMGGRASEKLVLDTMTSGAEDDLKQATQLARKMVLDWGMSKRFNQLALGGKSQQVFLGEEIAQRRDYSEETAREIDEEVMNILDESLTKAMDTLKNHRDDLDKLAEKLSEVEEVSGDAVFELLGLPAKSLQATNEHAMKEGEKILSTGGAAA
jgi:cell division protease FtsH